MADNQQQNTARPVRAKSVSAMVRVLLIFCTATIVVVTSLPTTILLIVGMVPTLVTYIVDLTPGRYACRCIAGLNIAGVAPFIDRLWSGPNTVEWALHVLGDPVSWLSFYGSSAIGWMLFLSLPNTVAAIRVLNGERSIRALQEKQKRLAHEWDLERSETAQVDSKTTQSDASNIEDAKDGEGVEDAEHAPAG